jgi:hypothetical protein
MQLITKQLIKLSQLNSLGPSSQTLKLADQIPPLPGCLHSFNSTLILSVILLAPSY